LRLGESRKFTDWAPLRAVALVFSLAGVMSASAPLAQAKIVLEERKLPMRFEWVACQPDCGGWISAVGIVTAETPKDFDTFANGRVLTGAAIVLDSSGGSVNDAIALGRRWRKLGLKTTVGTSIEVATVSGKRPGIAPQAYCESMCAFLLLAGQTRHVPEGARVRVHQIWMGDRADDARAATYSAQDLMIVERDIGRLAKYTFDMGGTGDLLALALSVPPWEDLHELSRSELQSANLVTTEAIADLLPPLQDPAGAPMAGLDAKSDPRGAKPVQDRFASDKSSIESAPLSSKSTKTAEAALPTGGVAKTPVPQAPH
jgi:hypothetical protein